MKTLFKWLLGIVIVLGIGVGVFFGVAYYMDSQFSDEEVVEKSDSEEREVRELSEEKFENSENADELNPFGDKVDQGQLTDPQIQDYIHKMSHQKVRANEKWGFYLITDERIAWLKKGVETVQENLTHDQVYLSILNRWESGDFSKTDRDHNTIWDLQGGTVGRASGVLSPEEEEEYINSAYEN